MTPTQRAAMQAAIDDLVLLSRAANINPDKRPSLVALRAALAEPVVEPNIYGWAIQHADGTHAHLRCKVVNFYGEIQEREPFTESDLRAEDREWVGLAPHTMVALFTSPPPPAEVPLLSDEDIAAQMMNAWGCASISPRQAPTFARAIELAVRQKAGLV